MIDKISEVFDVEPAAPSVNAATPVVEKNVKMTDDADLAKANIKALMATSATALQHALQVAVQSDSPRAYEVLATLLNTAADLNTRLVNIHERERKLVTPAEENQKVIEKNVTNNVVFSGTTAELNNLIMKRMNNEPI